MQSVKAGAEILEFAKGRSVAIVGDVLELGEYGEKIHIEIGEILGSLRIDVIVCVGELSKYIWQGAGGQSNSSAYYFETKQKLYDSMGEILENGDTVLVKASRGMHFEEIVEKLKQF